MPKCSKDEKSALGFSSLLTVISIYHLVIPLLFPALIQVRLHGSEAPNAGRVEVLHNGTWGTVCHNGWDLPDGHVVCHQLGYTNGAALTLKNSAFPSVRGNNWAIKEITG